MMIKKAPKVAAMGGTKRKRSVKGCGSCTPWAILLQAGDCGKCAFYRRIQLPSGGMRELCQLTGEKRPTCGMRGCHFLAGTWEKLDQILGLQKSRDLGNVGFPNLARPGNGLVCSPRVNEIVADKVHTAIHAIADNVGNRLDHIGRGNVQYPRGLAVSQGPGSVSLPFAFKNPKPCEIHR